MAVFTTYSGSWPWSSH